MTERWHAEGNMVLDENRLTVAYVVGQEEDNSDTVLMAAAPEMRDVLRDVAALLPAAARMHPKDLHKLQSRVVAALASAQA